MQTETKTKSRVPQIPAFRREAFDRDRNFVAAKVLLLNGKNLAPGAPFDKIQSAVENLLKTD